MPLALHQLKPYKSVVVGKIRDRTPLDPLLGRILDELADMLLHSRSPTTREILTPPKVSQSGDLKVGFLHYREQRPVSWTSDPTLKDSLHQLFLVAGRKSHVAILATDSSWKRAVANRFGRGEEKGLASLRQVRPGILNAAFVQGPARTLWLAGTHRHSSVKADNKVLTGPNLRDALDPIDDQTFYFTAARCIASLGEGEVPIGVAPRGSRIWTGASEDWVDCRDTLALLFDCLEEVEENPLEDPFPVLAVSTLDFKDLDGPYDMSLQPPEALADATGEDRTYLEAAEKLAYSTQFLVEPTTGPHVKADAWQDGRRVGRVEIKLNFDQPERITAKTSGTADPDAVPGLHQQILDFCGEPEWLKVRYDSGHTLSDGTIFRQKFRDVPFQGFDWVDFKGFEVGREKPEPLDAIGQQRSLFCWVQQFWPNLDGTRTRPGGWLACDDGSMEIADFIHLDPRGEGEDPVLTLIHVKGALFKESRENGENEKTSTSKRKKDDASSRRVSVSSYEVVTGQAIKNLRHLDRIHLEIGFHIDQKVKAGKHRVQSDGGLEIGLKERVGKLVWFNREKSSREAMLDALRRIKHRYNRKVVVVQPHLTWRRWQEARSKPESDDSARLRQLDTLLLAAQATCNALGAEFRVVVDRAGMKV